MFGTITSTFDRGRSINEKDQLLTTFLNDIKKKCTANSNKFGFNRTRLTVNLPVDHTADRCQQICFYTATVAISTQIDRRNTNTVTLLDIVKTSAENDT